MSDPNYRKGVLIVAFGALLLAPDSLMIRLMGMDQFPTMFWRGLVGGGVVTLAYFAVRRTRAFADMRALGWTGVAFAASFSATTFCFVFAVRETTVANALFLVSTSPVFAALISWLALKEPPDRRTIRTIALALMGVAVIAFGNEASAPGALWGDLAALAAAGCLAIGFNLARRVRPLAMTPMMGPSGLLTATICALAAPLAWPPGEAVAPLLAMGLLIMPIGAWCLTVGPRYIPAPEVSLLLLIEAAVAPIIVWVALAERPTGATLIGGAFILGAIAWSAAERMGRRAEN